ncbi:dihydrofolate reductase [Pelagibacterium xiamenense]|uniref:dihydrofolate reductase n=1 Tax=Pelagibacterium xiamenense TaxID=2901140 RepID=UPI001E564C02|nr:dihydrofolate reductase [Pelagibacterium xiamenense]MCD7060094.1 dihydrofolate reductase [Pelagibacterium xiamenense]
MSGIRISMIAAVAANGVIGSDGAMPWYLPTDFKHYKAVTMGKPLVVGRKTFESIGKPLPGRTNIVVTRSKDFAPEGVIVVGTLEDGIAQAKAIAQRDGMDEIFINGGAEIYRQALPLADRLYLTHVALSPEGDTFFPEIAAGDWDVGVCEEIVAGERDTAPFVVKIYDRKPRA